MQFDSALADSHAIEDSFLQSKSIALPCANKTAYSSKPLLDVLDKIFQL
jgi:hypothetical protein